MSTYEYNDLFIKCQETGKYHVFTFDIEGSKSMNNKTRYEAQIKLSNEIYATITIHIVEKPSK